MGRVRITPRADLDLEEIWFFVAQNDPIADLWLDAIEEKSSGSSQTTPSWGSLDRTSRETCCTCFDTRSSGAEAAATADRRRWLIPRSLSP